MSRQADAYVLPIIIRCPFWTALKAATTEGQHGFLGGVSPPSPLTELADELLTMEGNALAPMGVNPIYDTGCPFPTFGRQDCTVFRKVMSTEDTIQEFAPALRTNAQIEAFRVALQLLGDLTGFGLNYFNMDESRGYVKTATEVSSDNSALMRNIRRHENSLEGAIVDIARAAMFLSRSFGESIPDGGAMTVQFDDSIIQDTAAEKAQDMQEVGVTMGAWEYRMRWYGEEESVARARAAEVGTGTVKSRDGE